MPRPKGVKRKRYNFTLSDECINRLREFSENLGKPMSHIIEALVMGFNMKKVEPNCVKVPRRGGDLDSLGRQADEFLEYINKVLRDIEVK